MDALLMSPKKQVKYKHICVDSVKLSHCHGNHFSKSCFDNFDINLPKIHFYFKFYNFTICVYDIGC